MKLSFEHNTGKILIFTYVKSFRGIRYVSNVVNFNPTEINIIFKCSWGCKLKARMLRASGYLENEENCTSGMGVKNSMKFSVRTF